MKPVAVLLSLVQGTDAMFAAFIADAAYRHTNMGNGSTIAGAPTRPGVRCLQLCKSFSRWCLAMCAHTWVDYAGDRFHYSTAFPENLQSIRNHDINNHK